MANLIEPSQATQDYAQYAMNLASMNNNFMAQVYAQLAIAASIQHLAQVLSEVRNDSIDQG